MTKLFTQSTENKRKEGGKKTEQKKAKPASFKAHKKHAGPCLHTFSLVPHHTTWSDITPWYILFLYDSIMDQTALSLRTHSMPPTPTTTDGC